MPRRLDILIYPRIVAAWIVKQCRGLHLKGLDGNLSLCISGLSLVTWLIESRAIGLLS